MQVSEVLASCAVGVSVCDDTKSGWDTGLVIASVVLAVVVVVAVIALVVIGVERHRRRTETNRSDRPPRIR